MNSIDLSSHRFSWIFIGFFRIRCLLKSKGVVGVILSGVWHCCGLRVDSIDANSNSWTLYLHTWVSREQHRLLTSGCGFHVVLVGYFRVHVCFYEPCIVCIDCMVPTFSGMYFTWFLMFRVWWEWALVPLIWRSSYCKRGVGGEFEKFAALYVGIQYPHGSRGLVDSAYL